MQYHLSSHSLSPGVPLLCLVFIPGLHLLQSHGSTSFIEHGASEAAVPIFHILHFYCLLWAFHSNFSLTSFAFFCSCMQFAVLYSLGHLRFPNLSHSLTFSHITSQFGCKSCIQCSLPLHSLTHSSIMRTLCLMHTHHLLYTCHL